MALWGDIDISANKTGTVTTTTSSTTVNGAGTAFTTELEVGQYITITGDSTGTEHQIKSITSDTVLELYANPTEAETGKAFQVTTKPAYDNTNVFGINAAEAPGGVTPGWVKVTNGTGGRAGRTQYETLVAFGDHTKPSEASDADAGQFGELAFATNVVNASRTGAGTVQFTVTMVQDNTLSPTYQWQKSTDGGVTFANVADGSAASSGTNNVTSTYTTASFANAAAAVDVAYRVVVSATGANSVTSASGTVTIN